MRLSEMREELFFGLELGGMNAAAAAAQFDRVLEVKHFVIDDVFDGVARNARMVEDTANDNGVVGRVVVPEAVARVILAPGHTGPGQQAVEKLPVEIVENRL